MIRCENMVIIDAKGNKLEPHYPSYVVLFNPSFEEAVKTAKDNPRLLVFIFTTGEVDSQVDFSDLPQLLNLTKPFYIGNFRQEDRIRVATKIISLSIDLPDINLLKLHITENT